MPEDEDSEKQPGTFEQKFGFFILERVNKKTNQMQVELRTKSEGIPLAEAVVILEGWVKRVKRELQRPYTENLKFGK